MNWYLRLPAWFAMTVVATCCNWMLPSFRVMRDGPLDNAQKTGVAPRLPLWLSWFDTPDNSLLGDGTWAVKHSGTYWDMVAWLNRNSIYGFQWSVLSASCKGLLRTYTGNRDINHHTGTLGTLRVKCGDYWQYKAVTKFIANYAWVINLGWILDDESQERSMFVFSVRIRSIQ